MTKVWVLLTDDPMYFEDELKVDSAVEGVFYSLNDAKLAAIKLIKDSDDECNEYEGNDEYKTEYVIEEDGDDVVAVRYEDGNPLYLIKQTDIL